jgi:hypothetical protein
MHHQRYFLGALLAATSMLAACSKHSTSVVSPAPPVARPKNSGTNRIAGATMLGAPVAEAKVYKLLPGYGSSDDFEASGVYYLGGYFYIACDNMQKIPKIKSTLPINSSSNTMVSTGAPGSGSSNWESITYDSHGTANFYVVEESANSHGSVYQPRIYELDRSLNYQSRDWADYYFTSANNNKAFEGIQWVYRNDTNFMVAIVEGTGKIPVLVHSTGSGTDWVVIDSITLPPSVTFTDYAEICIKGDTIAVLSQQDSQFWLGTISSTSWTITSTIGVYQFPLGSTAGVVGAGDSILYANVEGISFINDSQIVVCSDKAKSSQPAYQQIKDQSVHIFTLPHH